MWLVLAARGGGKQHQQHHGHRWRGAAVPATTWFFLEQAADVIILTKSRTAAANTAVGRSASFLASSSASTERSSIHQRLYFSPLLPSAWPPPPPTLKNTLFCVWHAKSLTLSPVRRSAGSLRNCTAWLQHRVPSACDTIVCQKTLGRVAQHASELDAAKWCWLGLPASRRAHRAACRRLGRVRAEVKLGNAVAARRPRAVPEEPRREPEEHGVRAAAAGAARGELHLAGKVAPRLLLRDDDNPRRTTPMPSEDSPGTSKSPSRSTNTPAGNERLARASSSGASNRKSRARTTSVRTVCSTLSRRMLPYDRVPDGRKLSNDSWAPEEGRETCSSNARVGPCLRQNLSVVKYCAGMVPGRARAPEAALGDLRASWLGRPRPLGRGERLPLWRDVGEARPHGRAGRDLPAGKRSRCGDETA